MSKYSDEIREYVAALKEVAQEATQGEWTWSVLNIPLSKIGESVQKCTDMSPGKEFYFLQGNEGETNIAHFGNGPTSAANSRFASMARPEAMLELIGVMEGQAETIAAQQQVLDQIAAALGVEVGDVEGIGHAIEDLVKDNKYLAGLAKSYSKDAERYRFLRDQVGCTKHGPSLPCGYVSADRRIEMAKETDANIDKALAGGEAGNGN